MTMTKIQNGNAGQKGWVSMIKLSDALERIKQECLHNDCPHCPFDDGADGCLLTDANVIPCEWDFSVMRNADAAPTTSDNVNHPSHYTQGGVISIHAPSRERQHQNKLLLYSFKSSIFCELAQLKYSKIYFDVRKLIVSHSSLSCEPKLNFMFHITSHRIILHYFYSCQSICK